MSSLSVLLGVTGLAFVFAGFATSPSTFKVNVLSIQDLMANVRGKKLRLVSVGSAIMALGTTLQWLSEL